MFTSRVQHVFTLLRLILLRQWCVQGVTESLLLAAETRAAECSGRSGSRGHLRIADSSSVADSFYVWAAILLPHDLRAQSNYCQSHSLQVHMYKSYFSKLCSGFRLNCVLDENIWTVSFLCISRCSNSLLIPPPPALPPAASVQHRLHPFVCSSVSLCFYSRLH